MTEDERLANSRSHEALKVALLIETQVGPGRDMLQGIARYVRESGPWALHLEPRVQLFMEGWQPNWLRDWDGDGIIARFETDSLVQAVRRAGVPAVDVLGDARDRHFPLVHVDDTSIAQAAAEHLLERGFRQFGFVARANEPWSDKRLSAFAAAVGEQGCACSVLLASDFGDLSEAWDRFIEKAAQWIREQPKPLGLMLCCDPLGPPMTQACRQVGVAVPEEVAIVGVDNDEPLCTICDPPLTSVDPNHEEAGYQAAALLDRMMAGEPAPSQSLLMRPKSVVIRQSTDVSAIQDPIVSSAMSMIREHACNGLQVADVADRSPVSRSVLQRRFRAILGRSVHEEILRVQLRKAEELLRDSDLPLRTIAEKTGFKHQEYMGAVFKARRGMTPGQFRRRHQAT
ncbi:MAG TPA: DNA-binding transcriptional regulator [Tepidisphaeraceae bacterium]|jgi:LacI family transcriptional regulator